MVLELNAEFMVTIFNLRPLLPVLSVDYDYQLCCFRDLDMRHVKMARMDADNQAPVMEAELEEALELAG